MARARAIAGSLLFLVVGPGVVAGLVPFALTGWDEPAGPVARVTGSLLVAAGVAFLLAAFTRFALQGLGTPVPAVPTRNLVVSGSYRHVRNPMYLAVLAIILGQAAILGSAALVLYAAVVWLAFATFVRLYEEPTLSDTYGADYDAYRRAVPAWIPRLRPWGGADQAPTPGGG